MPTRGPQAAPGDKDRTKRVPIRGCVIGGTALLDASVRDHPYPSTTIAAEKTRVVEFNYSDLRNDMDENSAIEAAMLNILYFDLVEGLRRRGQYDYASNNGRGKNAPPERKTTIQRAETSDQERLATYDIVRRRGGKGFLTLLSRERLFLVISLSLSSLQEVSRTLKRAFPLIAFGTERSPLVSRSLEERTLFSLVTEFEIAPKTLKRLT